jgi:hypothetical protein
MVSIHYDLLLLTAPRQSSAISIVELRMALSRAKYTFPEGSQTDAPAGRLPAQHS